MPYYPDAAKISLADLASRIIQTDLVPSRGILQNDIDDHFKKLNTCGIRTLADLRKAVKSTGNINTLAQKANIDTEYLTLLRREIESYFPKPHPLSDYPGIDSDNLKKLAEMGCSRTDRLYEALEAPEKREELTASIGMDNGFAERLFILTGLTRIQWVSPSFAAILFEAGYRTAESIAKADAGALHEAVAAANEALQYFKGKIGIRDIKRLIKAAAYVS